MLRIYGDSFSYKYWMEEEDTYAYKLSKLLDKPYINKAYPALCNTEIFDRFLDDVNEFKEGDIIIYQFSTPVRAGYKFQNGSYYSTAGLRDTLEESIKIMNEWGGGREQFDVTDDDIVNLYNYIYTWQPKTAYYQWSSVDKVMQFVAQKNGIKYIYLFLDELFDPFIVNNSHTIQFPYEGNETNYALIHWSWHKELTLYHVGTGGVEWDPHPNADANTIIAELLKNKIQK